MQPTAAIDRVAVSAYRVPTDAPESDGTFAWDSTTLVLVRLEGGGKTGLGYTYADRSAATLIQDKLVKVIIGGDVLDVAGHWEKMMQSIRNLGRCGIAAMAVSAVDLALWDLKARCFNLPLVSLLGRARDGVPVYGSGGFTSYTTVQLQTQLADWAASGFKYVKMKIGREPAQDAERVRAARQAIGPEVELFVDANGAYVPKQALAQAQAFAEEGVTWFEEPVSSDDLDGLRLLRQRLPPPLEVAAGEYGFDLPYFRNLVRAGAVDVLQADITRCGGLTCFLKIAAYAEAHQLPLSAHTAPSAHLAACCAASQVRHIEYFHDHSRIEQMFFEGAPVPKHGVLAADVTRPGHGLAFKAADAKRYAI